jgi:CheY-like chemotaxis protein
MDPRVVLVADSDPHTCLLISNLLRSEGYRVVTAPAKLAGLQTMGLQRPDLLLVAAPTPPDAEDETLHAFHRRFPDTPIVLLSAPTGHNADARQPGTDRTLVKPIDPDTLLAVVHELVPIS